MLIVRVINVFFGKVVFFQDNWDGDGNYKVIMNLWRGINVIEYCFYENDQLIDI